MKPTPTTKRPPALRPALWPVLGLSLWLAACGSGPKPPPATVGLALPAHWQAPLPAPPAQPADAASGLPHHGRLQDLAGWWQRFDDPLLLRLIAAAQQASPTLASAASRIAQARATQELAAAALRPLADASASTSRGRQTSLPGAPLATLSQARLQASWETDLFGGLAATRNAAQARLAGAEAQWHEARVSVAAEVANQYVSLRACQAQLAVAQGDSQSRAATARLTQLNARAGFTPPATAALARASAAEGAAKLTQQKAQCDTDLKGLVALTALDEVALKQQVLAAPALPVQPASFALTAIPADALSQRPDLFNAARELQAASADVGSAQAERYPRLSLTGSIGQLNLRSGGSALDISTWSIGPVSLTVPVLDGGKFAANLAGAEARYTEAAANYRAKARQAVREVEEALVALDSANARRADVQAATDGYRAALAAADARYTSGLGSLLELEDTRRAALAAHNALIAYQRETLSAWIALYRAVGGGWTAEAAVPAMPTAAPPSP